MYNIIDFSHWTATNEMSSGANEKDWLEFEGKRGLFKYAKINNNVVCGEYWSELMASDLFRLSGLDAMSVSSGTYNGRLGSMCYDLIPKYGAFREMVDVLPSSNIADHGRFEVDVLFEISSLTTRYKLIKMFIMDFIIGNNDRHTGNFAINQITKELYPLYDNGSSLGCRLNDETIDIMSRDSMQYNAFLINKLKSCAVDSNGREMKCIDLLKIIENNDTLTYNLAKQDIINRITDKEVTGILNRFIDIPGMPSKMLPFLHKMIFDRLQLI